MASDIKVGRAEHEDDVYSCFENVPASTLLAPLFTNDKPSAVIGDRGTGKTRLLLMLSKEIPIEMHHLNKIKLDEGTLRYEKIANVDDPIAVVVDDLHYLTKAMQVSNMNDSRIKEEDVLDLIEGFKKDAEEKKSKMIVVADESPAALCLRFKEDRNKRRYLEMLEGIIMASDDMQFYMTYASRNPKESQESGQCVNLNNRGIVYQYANLASGDNMPLYMGIKLWEEELPFRMADKQFEARNMEELIAKRTRKEPSKERRRELERGVEGKRRIMEEVLKSGIRFLHDLLLYSKDEYENAYTVARAIEVKINDEIYPQMIKASENLTRTFKMKDIPFAYSTRRIGMFFPMDKDGYIVPDTMFERDEVQWEKRIPDKPIATIRQLKVIADRKGGVSMENISRAKMPEFGRRITGDLNAYAKSRIESIESANGILYEQNEIMEIRERILETYHRLVGYSPMSLARSMMEGSTDAEVYTTMLKHDLALE